MTGSGGGGSREVVDARLGAGFGEERVKRTGGEQLAHVALRVVAVAKVHAVCRANRYTRGVLALFEPGNGEHLAADFPHLRPAPLLHECRAGQFAAERVEFASRRGCRLWT